MKTEPTDLLSYPELIPDNVQAIIDKHCPNNDEMDYNALRLMETELNAIGYAIDWGLDAVPYNLRPLNVNADKK